MELCCEKFEMSSFSLAPLQIFQQIQQDKIRKTD